MQNERGTLINPIYHTPNTWDERTHQLEETIRNSAAFEGKFQTYMKDYKLVIPEPLRKHLCDGGVITVSTEKHLLLFGHQHWLRFSRLLAKEVGLSPVHNAVARHIYGKMTRFNGLHDDGSIDIPLELANYANLHSKIAIIGLVYHAEVHNLEALRISEKPDSELSMLAKFKKLTFK